MECVRARPLVCLLGAALLVSLAARPCRADFESVFVEGSRILGTDRTSGSTGVDAVYAMVGPNKIYARLGLNVNADQSAGGEPVVENGVGLYTIRFTIENDRDYILRVTTHRLGVLRRLVDQADCSGFVSLAAVAGPSVQQDDGTPRVLTSLALPAAAIEAGTGGVFLPVDDTAMVEGELGDLGISTYTMTFSMSALAFSDTCEVSALLGAQNAATTGCTACEYPGDRGGVFPSDEGLFVNLELIPQQVCGDGNLQGGEECDLGAGNGAPDSCCTSACQFRSQGEVCRAASDACDKADVCSGASGACAADAKQDDGFRCGPNEACSESLCQAGLCVPVNKTGPCDDGAFCRTNDRCVEGQCVGLPVPCPERTVCDESIDACREVPEMLMRVSPITPRMRGGVMQYEVTIGNPSSMPADIDWFDVLPEDTTYIAETLSASIGSTDDSDPTFLRWHGTLPARGGVRIEFDASINTEAACPAVLDNSAVALLPGGAGVEARARVDVLCAAVDPGTCAGDCGGDDVVTVDELVVAANNLRANPAVPWCAAVDTDGSASVSLPELKTAVETALGACLHSFAGLAGSWTGPLYRVGSSVVFGGQQTLTLQADGAVDGIVGEQSAQLSPLDRSDHIFAFQRGDGITGALQFSADGRHALYIDELFIVGALEKDATALAPSYAESDLGFDYWYGNVVRYGPAERAAGEGTPFTVDSAAPFWGLIDPAGGFSLVARERTFASSGPGLDLSADPGLAAIGVFEGDWMSFPEGNGSGDAAFLMTPDKNFLAALMCSGPFPQCDISAWSRVVVLPQGSLCSECLLATPPTTLRCVCSRDDQLTNISSALTLPCRGSIAIDDGILTCR